MEVPFCSRHDRDVGLTTQNVEVPVVVGLALQDPYERHKTMDFFAFDRDEVGVDLDQLQPSVLQRFRCQYADEFIDLLDGEIMSRTALPALLRFFVVRGPLGGGLRAAVHDQRRRRKQEAANL